MEYFFELITNGIKRAFDEHDAVGVSVVIPISNHQGLVDAINEAFGKEECYVAIDGANVSTIKCPPSIHLSGEVEKAVEWRNMKKAQGHIIFNCARLKKRSHSLDEFKKITPRDVVISLADDQARKAPNVPIRNFWEAIGTIEGEGQVQDFPLKNVLDFLKRTEGKKTGFEKELCALQLIPDKQILNPSIDVSTRIIKNCEIIEQLHSMDDIVQRRMASSLLYFNKDEKKAYRILLDYFRNGDFDALAELDLDTVIDLMTKVKTQPDQPPTPSNDPIPKPPVDPVPINQDKPQNPSKTLVDDFVNSLSGDESSKERVKDFGQAVMDYIKDHDPFDEEPGDKPSIEDPKTGTTIPFPLAKLDRNLYKLIMSCASLTNWGGVVLSDQVNLHDTIADADSICTNSDLFTPFTPSQDVENPFFTKNACLKTVLQRFDEAIQRKSKNSKLFELFCDVENKRKNIMPYLDALLRYGHVAIFGCNQDSVTTIREYVDAWKSLFDEFRRVEEDMHEISDKQYQHAARCMLSLDVLFIRIKQEWKAIMLPSNPLFLWIYSEIYGQIGKGDYDMKNEEFRAPFIKALKCLPNLVNFQIVPREIYALSDAGANDDYILPCSGAQGILPTFENKTNRYLGSDGMECIEDTITRYLAFAPYAGNDLRISVVDVPDVMECVRIVARCISDRKQANEKFAAATLYIYRTESHSGGREMDDLDFVKQDSQIADLIQSDNLRVRVVHCKNINTVTDNLKSDPVHLAFFFDQSTYQVSYGANTRELYITPLVVTYDFTYDTIQQDGEIYPNTDTNNGFLGSYYGILDKSGSTCSQSRVPRTSYLKTAELDQILSVTDNNYSQWMIAADRVVYNYVPKEGLPIGVKNFGRRNVCIWANKKSRVIQQFIILLKKYNLHPTRDALVGIFNRFGHISGEGLVGVPAKSSGVSEAANSRRKGMLGTVFAAKWYTDKYPNSLIASLDSEESRTWLSKTETETGENDRADLVGFRFDENTNCVIIDVLEVKTRKAEGAGFSISTINGKKVLHGHAPDQVAYVLKRLHQVFESISSEGENMFVAARRETLKYQIVNECFRSKYLTPDMVQKWSELLKKVFDGQCPITINGFIIHVDLENNSSEAPDFSGIYEGAPDFSINVVSLTAGRIQKEIFGDIDTEKVQPVFTQQQPQPSDCDVDETDGDNAGGVDDTHDEVETDEQDNTTQEDAPTDISSKNEVLNRSDENVDALIRAFKRACLSFQIKIADCDASSAKIGPSVIQFYLTLQSGQKIETLRKALPDIGRQISRTQLRIQQVENTDKIAVDVIRTKREFVNFEDKVSLLPEVTAIEQMPLLIGQTPAGEDIVRRLDEMPHMLVGGTTGSGKSVFLSTLLLSLLIRHRQPEQLRILITSSKPEDFIAFEQIPHLMTNSILSSAEDAINYIQNEIFEESERRKGRFIEERVANISLYNEHMRNKKLPQLPPIVVLIDEFADLADNISSKEDREAFYRTLRQIAQAGRSRGIHLILCTQRPSSKLLDTNIKAQLPGRVALTVADANSAKMILDEPDSGAERLQGKGDMLFKDVGRNLSRAQGYSVDLDNLFQLVQKQLSCPQIGKKANHERKHKRHG